MNELTTFLVALVGVAGTLLATLIAQRGQHAASLAQAARSEQKREQDRRDQKLQSKLDLYAGLHEAAQIYHAAGRNAVLAMQGGGPVDLLPLDEARSSYFAKCASVEMVLPDHGVEVTTQVTVSLGIGYLFVKQMESGNNRNVVLGRALEWNSSALARALPLLRDVLRHDLKTTDLSVAELRSGVQELRRAAESVWRDLGSESIIGLARPRVSASPTTRV